MNSQTLLSLFLILHISGFTVMGGTIVADFTMYSRLRKYLFVDKSRALTMLDGSVKFSMLISIAAILLILTGIGMVIIFHGVVARMLWFKIKMILVLFIVINGALIARPSGIRLRKALGDNSNDEIAVLDSKLYIFYVIELTLFLAVFILSVFKF
jgi:hypothetical protein